MQIDFANKIEILTHFLIKFFIFIMALTLLLFWKSTKIKAEYLCTYRTWGSDGNLYFQMVDYPELWNYTHIYFDTNSLEPDSASNDNESSWNLGTWPEYNSNWEDKWCGIRSGTGYDMGCNTNNWPATMPNPIWTFTGVTNISRVYIAVGDDRSNTDCILTTSTPNPTPSQSPTAIPTPIPPPVSKVIFVPGFGASWNAKAFANCAFDNNPDDWSLAPYAESVYRPILTALTDSGWIVKPFYYDWRQNVSTNASSLYNKISSDVTGNEKINLIGHSMGGLIGKTYLENSSGEKLNKMLTAGSPFIGVPQTYPAWSGGDIWEDNFLIKTAMTLYLKHCASLFASNREAIQQNVPSVANMLPTFDYLKYNKNGEPKPVSSMIAQNTWHSNNDFDSHGVDVETISGTGLSTLSGIQIKDASKQDTKNGDWLDGKPAGKIYSYDGDRTVLASSSKLPGVPDIILNQNHEALVSSVDGMAEILRFIGSPPTTLSSIYVEPTSALVVIGYPGNFWLIDENGNTQKDKGGMVSILDPRANSYKINIIPQSKETLFVVAQFLPNGQTLYREYHFEGYGPKFKTLKFDLQNPKEDILN